MQIFLKNGDELSLEDGARCSDAAKAVSESLARNAVAAKINGKLTDLSAPLSQGDKVEFVTLKDKEGLEVYRHTCAHVLAQAVKTIFPTCNLAIGPVVDNGFYYDIDFNTPITQEDFEKIEAEMQKIIKANSPIERFELSRKEAIELMTRFKEKYKVEIINELRFKNNNKSLNDRACQIVQDHLILVPIVPFLEMVAVLLQVSERSPVGYHLIDAIKRHL